MKDHEISQLIQHNDLAAGIRDAIFEIHTNGKQVDLGGIIDDLCCWVGELHLQNQSMQMTIDKAISSGFMRRDTSNLTVLHPVIATEVPAVDDEWIVTGRESRQ